MEITNDDIHSGWYQQVKEAVFDAADKYLESPHRWRSTVAAKPNPDALKWAKKYAQPGDSPEKIEHSAKVISGLDQIINELSPDDKLAIVSRSYDNAYDYSDNFKTIETEMRYFDSVGNGHPHIKHLNAHRKRPFLTSKEKVELISFAHRQAKVRRGSGERGASETGEVLFYDACRSSSILLPPVNSVPFKCSINFEGNIILVESVYFRTCGVQKRAQVIFMGHAATEENLGEFSSMLPWTRIRK